MKTAVSYFTLLLLFGTVLSTTGYSNAHKWACDITLAKKNYVSHEPIWLDITLSNISDDTLRTHGLDVPNHRQFFVLVTDQYGDSVQYTGPNWNIATSPGRLLLDPGETDYGSFDLTKLFASFDINSGYSVPLMRFPYIPRGTYTVHVLFDGVTPNELAFSIVEPEGEDAKALRAMESTLRTLDRDHPKPTADKLAQIADRYPNRPFSEMCLYLAHFYSHMNEMKQGTYSDEAKRAFSGVLLEHYPNSGHAKDWLWSVTHQLTDGKVQELEREETMSILDRLLEDHPDTRCYRFAEQKKRRLLKDVK